MKFGKQKLNRNPSVFTFYFLKMFTLTQKES